MIIEYPSRPAKCKDCIFCGYYHPKNKDGTESRNHRHKCKRTEKDILLTDRVCDNWKMGSGIPRNYNYIEIMKKFRIKKGALLKIEGLPLMLSQDAIIVECETDLTKTELLSDIVKAHIEKISEDGPLDYRQRVIDEASELNNKRKKLKDFINSERFEDLIKRDQVLLIKQLAHMDGYSDILGHRIALFTPTENA